MVAYMKGVVRYDQGVRILIRWHICGKRIRLGRLPFLEICQLWLRLRARFTARDANLVNLGQ